MRRGRILGGALGLLLGLLVAAPASASVPGEFFGLGGFDSPGQGGDCPTPVAEDCVQGKWDRLWDAGIRTWRIGIHWNNVQPTPPPEEGAPDYNWNAVDVTVRRAARAGIRTVPRIYQAPNGDPENGGWSPTGCTDCPPIGPESEAMGHWKAMVAAAARRYGRCAGDTEPGFDPGVDCAEESFWKSMPPEEYFPIKWWQVWEEPNFQTRWRKPATQEQIDGCQQPDPDPALNCDRLCQYAEDGPVLQCKESAREYAQLVRATHEGITDSENGDPTAKILLGGLPEIAEESGTKQTDFLRFIYIKGKKGEPGFDTAGIKSYLDGVALHPYSTGKEGVRGSLIRAKDAMKKYGHWNYHGVKIQLMLTEFGFASDSRVDPPEPFVSSPYGERRKLKKTFKMLVNNRDEYHLARAFWFGYHDRVEDHPSGNGWYAYTGLFFSEDCALADEPVPPAETIEESKPGCVPDDNGNQGNFVDADHPDGSRAKPAWCGYLETTHTYLLTPSPDAETYAECFDPPYPPLEP